ncbi:hypothetical protein HBI82_180880 [Parastagonospora nodorum]|nr:hypothetical protein HBH61_131590 [Parastagonospora nodorum]KAH4961935.1 hypothetical protein HBI78_136880 [Parastagonospora nodorum]KAH5994524.1 hypothetical protein HBI82_180880 [Parastagonospora nodorum]
MLAVTYRALAPVFQCLAACFRMLFHYPIVVLQTLYCFLEAISVKTHFIVVECILVMFVVLFFAMAFIFATANDRHKADEKKMGEDEVLAREDQNRRHFAEKEKQHDRHIADKEACHLRQVEEIETYEELIVGIVLNNTKSDQIHAALLKKLSELVTLQEVDQAIAQHMKVVSGSAAPSQCPYPAISDTMAAFSVDIGVHMQLQINEAVARGYERLMTSPPLSYSPIQSQETMSTPPTWQKPSLSISPVSSTETTPISPPNDTLSISDVVAQDTAPVASAKPVLSLSLVSSQDTEPLDICQSKLSIGPIVSQSTAPLQAQPLKLSMSKIEAVSTSPLEVAPTPLAISEVKTVLEQAPVSCQAISDAAEAKEVVAQLLAVINGWKTRSGKYQGLTFQCITFDVDRLQNDEAASALKDFKKKVNMLFFGYAQNEDAARSDLRLATSESDRLKSEIDVLKSAIDGLQSDNNELKSAIIQLKSEMEGYAGAFAAMQCEDYDEDLDQFEQQLAEQGEQVVVADEAMTPVITGIVATAAPLAPVSSLPDISVPTQTHVAAAAEEPVKALSPPPSFEKKVTTPPATGLFASSFASEVSSKPPNFPVPVHTPIKIVAKVFTPPKVEHEVASSSGNGLLASAFASAVSSKPANSPAPVQSNAETNTKAAAAPTVNQAARSTGTDLFASIFASEVSSKPPTFPVPVQSHTGTEAKTTTPTPSAPKIEEVTENAENGIHCDICDLMVTGGMKKHAENCHGYCMICKQMVSGDWTNDRFTYDKHKEQCRTIFKPESAVKAPVIPKPSAATSKTLVHIPKPPTTPTTSGTTKTFVCRHCHEDVIAPVITVREGHQIGDFSKHNITCRGARTYVKFYCVNCGMGVTNTDQFHAEHRQACQKEASKIGNFRAFDKTTGLRIGESTEGLPPMAPRVMLGRTDGSRSSKPPTKGRGPMLGSRHSTPVKIATPEGSQAEREARGRGAASSSPLQPQWEGNVIRY